MPGRHFHFWPTHAMPMPLAPATNVFYNAEVSARRYPDKRRSPQPAGQS